MARESKIYMKSPWHARTKLNQLIARASELVEVNGTSILAESD
jgi:hypothetical protein